MRAISSYSNGTNMITNSYQRDKDTLNTYIDKMKKSIDSGDYESAKALLEEANKLVQTNSAHMKKSKGSM
jgi:ribosomal protein S20